MGTEAYVGWRGHGKTMLAVERARRLAIRRSCSLIANIWVRDEPGLVVERIPLGSAKGSKSAGMDMDWLIDRLWALKEQKQGAVVLLDEAGVLFSAREWQRFPPELGYLIAQGRRLRVDLVYTSQFIDQVDKILREMTEVAHKVRAWPAPTVLGRETGRRPLIMWTSTYRPSAVDQAEKRLGRSFMWYRQRRERDYDTDEFVLPLRYRTDGRDAGGGGLNRAAAQMRLAPDDRPAPAPGSGNRAVQSAGPHPQGRSGAEDGAAVAASAAGWHGLPGRADLRESAPAGEHGQSGRAASDQ